MFRWIGRFSIRYRFPVVAAWIVLAGCMALFAPKLSKVGVSDASIFLAENAKSVLAGKELLKRFPENAGSGRGLVVFTRAGGLTADDEGYARGVVDWLTSSSAPKEIGDVESAFRTPALRPMLVSPDNAVMLVNVAFSTAPSSEPTNQAIDAVRAQISAPPAGLQVHVTGSAGASRDTLNMVKRSVDATTFATVILVIVVLLLIYRSPVAAAVPLVTIGAAYLVARGVLGFLAQGGLRMSTQTDVFIVVVIFGVGTDYCLFIVSRFREELDRHASRVEAGVRAMERIGAVITASAVVVMLAFMFLNVAQFQLTRTLGISMAIAILMTLLAGLTLTPALIGAAGSRLFWPFAQRPMGQSPAWRAVSAWGSRHGAIVVPVVIAVLLIPYIALPQLKRNFDFLTELPADQDSVQGYNSVVGHFDQGELSPIQIMLVTEDGDAADRLDAVAKAAETVRGVPGVRRVRSLLTPTGDPAMADAFLVDKQLSRLSGEIGKMSQSLTPGSGATATGPEQGLAALTGYLNSFAARFPEFRANGSYMAAQAAAQDLREALSRIEPLLLVSGQLDLMADSVSKILAAIQAPSGSLAVAPSQIGQLEALPSYFAGLAQQYPEIAGDASFKAITAIVADLTKAGAGLETALRVHGQLRMIASQLEQMQKSLSNPLSLVSLNTQGQLEALEAYMTDLGRAFPSLAQRPEYSAGRASFQGVAAIGEELKGAGSDMAKLSAGLDRLGKELGSLAASLRGLADYAEQSLPQAVYAPKVVPGGSATPANPVDELTRFGLEVGKLASTFQTKYPTARYLPTNLPGSEQLASDEAALMSSLGKLTLALDEISASFAGRQQYFYSEALFSQVPEAAALGKVFLSEDGKAARLYVVLQPAPYSNDALDVAWALRESAEAALAGDGIRPVVSGEMIAMADIRYLMGVDFYRVLALTIVGILVVMILLLRSVVAPVYLVATVVLSYGSAMGLSVALFQGVLGHAGLNLLLPTVVLVMLVALGADYNIFLMSRVREETAAVDFREGLVTASSRTGAIITSCGIVLAGTFGTMMLAPLRIMFQIGGAVAMGVVLDTFVIRAVLVPALASLLKRRNWWPGR